MNLPSLAHLRSAGQRARARLPNVRRVALALSLLCASAVLGLSLAVALEPLPAGLAESSPDVGLSVLDRHGRLVRELRAGDGKRRAPVRLEELSPQLAPALIATEDRRFFWHRGVDPLAILRAAGQALAAGRLVSGASTLTQQLARALVPRPRTVAGKLHEMVVALRIEASLDKREILEAYLSRVEFGPNLVGIQAASRHYFDKPALQLDLAEAAALVAIVRGPSFYDPRRGTERLRKRRDRILERLHASGTIDERALRVALDTELRVRPQHALSSAEHLAFAIAHGKLVPALAGRKPVLIETTLDLALQREVEVLARRVAADLHTVGASALSVLVIDNREGEVLAYLGSPDYFASGALGGNDGTRALRQPGSALKPFIYAAGMERLGWTPATLFSDRTLELDTPNGLYVPANYDGREHGPVRLRLALANSLNLTAVRAAAEVGAGPALSLLHRFGFDSLDQSPQHYGPALALGAGEVRLGELARAYSALSRDGELKPLRYARSAVLDNGERLEMPLEPGRRVLDPRIARQLTSMLADDAARSESFGSGSALHFPFSAAAKTGTSKGFRDNWAVGYTRERTVAVWVGNFDGRPMVRSSGVSGAGPLFHEVLLAAMRGITPEPLLRNDGLLAVEICALSGAMPGPACGQRVVEHFLPERSPRTRCQHHELVAIDPSNGLRAGPGCADARQLSFERYPEAEAGSRGRERAASPEQWAREAGRPLAPRDGSPRCPPGKGVPANAEPKSGGQSLSLAH
jgi:penicillin-binding protein 1C